MGRFLNTLGNASLSIAICDRCRMKRAYSVISQDGNIPGLRVCNEGCSDQFDPYRLPARQTEKITIRFPRPDVSVIAAHNALVTNPSGGLGIALEQTDDPIDGNLDTLSP